MGLTIRVELVGYSTSAYLRTVRRCFISAADYGIRSDSGLIPSGPPQMLETMYWYDADAGMGREGEEGT